MKLNIWGLMMVTVVVLIIGFGTFFLESGAPTIYAQTTLEGWKTYYNPNLKFAIDYPLYSGPFNATTNITETTDRVYFHTYDFFGSIAFEPNSILELEEYAVFMQQYFIKNTEQELTSSVKTVVFNGEVGYSFILYDPSNGLYSVHVFFHSPGDMDKHYSLLFSGRATVGGEFPDIDEFVNTIRFFS
ncbi:hypothetical protein BH23THE1_BH23THE1_18060 [soil metagenome]